MRKINVIVKSKFIDKYTGQIRRPGDRLTITECRFREILRSGNYVEVEKAKKTEETVAEIKK